MIRALLACGLVVAAASLGWAEEADPQSVPEDPTPVSKDAPCVDVYLDDFAVPVAEPQYGRGVRQEVRVQLCSYWYAKDISVEQRLYREYADGKAMKRQEIYPWTSVGSARIDPFLKGEYTGGSITVPDTAWGPY